MLNLTTIILTLILIQTLALILKIILANAKLYPYFLSTPRKPLGRPKPIILTPMLTLNADHDPSLVNGTESLGVIFILIHKTKIINPYNY